MRRTSIAVLVIAVTSASAAGALAAGSKSARPSAKPRSSPSPSPTATASPATTSSASPTAATNAIWRPALGATWQIQYTGTLDTSVPASIFNVDGFDTTSSAVSALHNNGRKAICYFSAGSWEDWRPDASKFPASVLGNSNGWPGERWVDVRRLDLLGPVMEARMDMCKGKGFDAVDPDNVDGYANNTGFPLTGDDQLRYNRWLAQAAHQRGLSISLKNDLGQVAQLAPDFDFAVNEQCVEYAECGVLAPFVSAGKPVFHIEYNSTPSTFCALRPASFSSLQKRLSLDAWYATCP